MNQSTDRVRRLISDEVGECCESDLENRLDELREIADSTDPAAVDHDSTVCQALGSETRLRLLRYLAAADRQLCVCELEQLSDVSDSAVSHALSDLHDAGLVVRDKRGKWRYYEPTDAATELLATLDRLRPARERR